MFHQPQPRPLDQAWNFSSSAGSITSPSGRLRHFPREVDSSRGEIVEISKPVIGLKAFIQYAAVHDFGRGYKHARHFIALRSLERIPVARCFSPDGDHTGPSRDANRG